MTSGRLPVPAHEGAGPCGVAAGVVGPVGITRTWGHSPGVGAFDAVGDISARPGAVRASGDRNPVPGRTGCSPPERRWGQVVEPRLVGVVSSVWGWSWSGSSF